MINTYNIDTHALSKRIIAEIEGQQVLNVSLEEIYALAKKHVWIEKDYFQLRLKMQKKDRQDVIDGSVSTLGCEEKRSTIDKIMDKVGATI